MLLQADGHHAEAIDRFTAALRSRPGDTAARVRLAASLRRTGRAKDALSHYEQVVAMKPDLTEARFGHAIALVQVGRYREARDRLTEGMKAGSDLRCSPTDSRACWPPRATIGSAMANVR